ncbi:tetratricopeptide repeat protein [Alkalinema pantanalense CENA528]|uniref:tetratricopeptide repeat protein n=1 Tax=Alkalinema pantanalense TaxID=1620705 RepID=UPI003D6E8524
MAANSRLTWKEKRDRIVRSDFIGRQEQLAAFRASVTDVDAQTVIFGISGQGGVGKTTLLKEFRRIAEECGQIAAYVDEGSPTNRVEDVPEALWRLAQDFAAQNGAYKFEKFQERYKTYRQKKQELEADPEAPSGIWSGVGRTGTKVLLGGVKALPGMGEVMEEFVDRDALAEKGGELLSFAWKKFRNQDEVQLVTEPLEVLTPLFLEEMNRIAAKQMVVLLLDTYEVTGKFLDDWLRAVLDCRYGDDLTSHFRLCIAGREPLDRNAWVELEGCIARSPLELFTEEEARRFLASKGITSEAVIQEIWRLSGGGLPLLVSMMAQNAPTTVAGVEDHCEVAVERFLKWESDGARRQLALEGACARVLDEDVVAVLGDGAFEWLKGCAFVVRDGACWRYHSVVREQMVRYGVQRSGKRWAEVHGKLAKYYGERQGALGLEAGKEAKDGVWRGRELERVYHELCVAPQGKVGLALNGFLRALKQSQAFARDWAGVMVQAGQEAGCEALQQWGERLRKGLVAQQEKRYEEAILVLTALLAEVGIEEKLRAVALDWRGCWYRRNNQEEAALKDLQQAVEIDGEDSEYWFDLALTCQNLKRYDEAITAYQKAIELNPKFAYPHNGLGAVYYYQKRYDEAISAYQKAIELDPKYASPHYNLGNLYQEHKRYDEAITAYEKAIEIDSKFAPAHNNLGKIYQELKNNTLAIQSYHQALESPDLFSAHTFAYSNLGDIYREQEEYDEAITAYRKSIELDPKYASPHNNLGNLYQEQKQYEKAIVAYERAIELDPKNAMTYYNLGILYKEQEQYDKAIVAYQKVIEIDSKFAPAHNNLGKIYQELKNNTLAIQSYHQALESPDLFSAHTVAYSNLGDIYREQEEYDEAITAYGKSIELDPNYIFAQEQLGHLQYRLEQYSASLESFQKALNLQPDNLTFRNNSGYLNLLQGDFQTAVSLIQQVLEKDNFDRAWLNYGLVQVQRGELDEAKQSWQKGLDFMVADSDWNQAVHCVFTVALGNITHGFDRLNNLIQSCTDKFALRNALNDAIILSRSPQAITGIDQVIQLLQAALAAD